MRFDLRRLLAFTLISFSLVHFIITLTRLGDIHPSTHLGWLNEQFIIGCVWLFFGTITFFISRNSNIKDPYLELSAFGLMSAFSIIFYSRYFWISMAVLTLLGLLTSIRYSFYIKNSILRAISVLMYVCLLFLALSFFSLGLTINTAKDRCTEVHDYLSVNFSDAKLKPKLFTALSKQIADFKDRGLEQTFCFELKKNFEGKFLSKKAGTKITEADLISKGILFETFKIETFIASGVAPKRYFGFLDEQGSTAKYEALLRKTIIDAVRISNDFAFKNQLRARISEKEVLITFLAEGGALILTTPEYSYDRVHPIRGIGLDDFRSGFKSYPQLVNEFDSFFGTNLNSLLFNESLLVRTMTFQEAILGTALMYLYEKEITAHKTETEWGEKLMELSLTKQFITTSLVYNSGIFFSKERVQQIENFSTGDYLTKLNQESDRPKLKVYSPAESLRLLKSGETIPLQLTSWSAVYHILQRYGAWVALDKYSEYFQNGEYRRFSNEPKNEC